MAKKLKFDGKNILTEYASKDAQGNDIVNTYAKKSDIPAVIQYITGGDGNWLEEASFSNVTIQQLATNIGWSVEDTTLLVNGTYPILTFMDDSGIGGGYGLLFRTEINSTYKNYVYLNFDNLCYVYIKNNNNGTYNYSCRVEQPFMGQYGISVSGDTLTITEYY